MAKELHAGVTYRVSKAIYGPHPTLGHVNLAELVPYYKPGDFSDFIFNPGITTLEQGYENIFTLALLILAAEDELEGYLL